MASSFAAWLAERMRERGLQQIDLEDLSGVSNATISRILKGESRPSPPNVLKLAHALDGDVPSLMRLAGYPVAAPAAPGAAEQELLLLVRNFPWLQEMIPDILALSSDNRALVLGIVRMMLKQQGGDVQ